MPIEQTLSMIKPDGVKRGLIGEVTSRFEKNGLKIKAMKMLRLTLEQARAFYAVHQERPFYDSLTQFMSSGPIVAMILEGENAIQVNRDLMGATDYRQAAPGTLRDDCAAIDLGGPDFLLWTIDTLVEGVHFDPAYITLTQLGHKSLAVNLSDI